MTSLGSLATGAGTLDSRCPSALVDRKSPQQPGGTGRSRENPRTAYVPKPKRQLTGRSAMFSRRTFLSLVAGSMAAPGLASAQPASQKVALYANVGADLTHY